MKQRVEGQIQPHIKAGIFHIRIPFVHYSLPLPEIITGLVLAFVHFAVVPIYTDVLGMTIPQAYTVVITHVFLMLLHTTLGDAAPGGWITASIPLTVAFISGFPEGVERIHALIAVQFWVGAIILVLGVSGLAKTVVGKLPQSLKAGVLMGAGIAGFFAVLSPHSTSAWNIANFPLGIGVTMVVVVALVWSHSLLAHRGTVKWIKILQQYAMPVGFLVGVVVGTISGEIPPPEIMWGFVPTDFAGVISGFSVIGIGFPSAATLAQAFPLGILIYVIAYGDMVFGQTLIGSASKRRPDEKIDIHPGRAHIVVAIRNFIHIFTGPLVTMAGPYWTSLTAVVVDRWQGSKQMSSLFSGLATVVWFLAIGAIIGPIISIPGNAFEIALAITLIMQGFVAAYIAMGMIKYVQQAGIAFFMAVTIAFVGVAQGLGLGIILYFLVEFRQKREDRFEEVEEPLPMVKESAATGDASA